MITAGVDSGIENTRIVILKDGQVTVSLTAPSGGSGRAEVASGLWRQALEQAGLKAAAVDRVTATGQGKREIDFARDNIVDTVAETAGARWLFPQARSIIGVGADQSRAVMFDADGKITQYALNQKCAAGLGLFIESQALLLGLSMDEISKPSPVKKKVAVNDQCAVFAELDIVTLIHDNTPVESIVNAIHEAVAARIASMVNETTLDRDIVLVGGVARNGGVIGALKNRLGCDLLVPEQPEFCGALGAALTAAG